jgi:hypothetical protein
MLLLSSIKQVSLELSDAGHKPAHTLLRVPRHREEETYPDDPGSEGNRGIRAEIPKDLDTIMHTSRGQA